MWTSTSTTWSKQRRGKREVGHQTAHFPTSSITASLASSTVHLGQRDPGPEVKPGARGCCFQRLLLVARSPQCREPGLEIVGITAASRNDAGAYHELLDPEVTPSTPTAAKTAKWAQPCKAPHCGPVAHAWLCVICGGTSGRITCGYDASTGCRLFTDTYLKPFTKWNHGSGAMGRVVADMLTTESIQRRAIFPVLFQLLLLAHKCETCLPSVEPHCRGGATEG